MAVVSLFPILATPDLPALTDFYISALGGEVTYRFSGPDGMDEYVALALGSASLGIGRDPAVTRSAGDPIALWFYVDDVDDAYSASLKAGATASREPTDMPWGERVAQVRDPAGNLVNFAAGPEV
jgi:uncharacterized glyoxalase superfamily protein PhnB